MKSDTPKPLHAINGRPMVQLVLDATDPLRADWTVAVVGHGAERMMHALHDVRCGGERIHFVEQRTQRGTGDAVQIALSSLPPHLSEEEDADVLVLPGDMPLLESEVIASLLDKHRQSGAAATMLTATPDDPFGYGRIVRNRHHRIIGIVEEADASDEQRGIREVNTSVYAFRSTLLGLALGRINDQNAQSELLLTDVISVLAEAGHLVESVSAPEVAWAVGVNDRAQLADAETELRRRVNEKWMKSGVTLVDPLSTVIDHDVVLEKDVVLLPGTILQGNTQIGVGSRIGPNVRLEDTLVGKNVRIEACVSRKAEVGDNAVVGPFVALGVGAKVATGEVLKPFEVRGDGEFAASGGRA